MPTIRNSARKRDAFKAASAGVTGLTAFGALAVTGVVAGAAAHDQALKTHADQARQPEAAPAVQPATRRPHRTIVRTTVVHVASAASTVAVARGGTVRSSTSSTTRAHTVRAPVSAPAPAPAPKPKSAPAPAPSSGS